MAAFQHPVNKYLLEYLNEMRGLLAQQLVYRDKENDNADMTRGGIKVIDSYLEIPNLIQKRLEYEKKYKERIAEIGSEG